MNEAFRILRPQGMLFLITPAFPSPAAFQDPTHVNFITVETINYFLGPNAPADKLGYGFEGSFALVAQFWMGPFSQIFSSVVNSESQSVQQRIFTQLSIGALRRVASCILNPTHLVWLLQKNSASIKLA
jgi:hypothetical protein